MRGVVAPLTHLVGGLVDALLPQTCIACGAWMPSAVGLICPDCDGEVRRAQARPCCRRCGRTLPPPAIDERDCARCRTERFWNVAGVARVGLYSPALRSVLTGLKYRGRLRNAEYLAERMADAVRARGWHGQIDALVPVPMHWLRRRLRPCDHALVLAEALGRRLHLPVWQVVSRERPGPSQTRQTSRAARFENIRGAFELRRAWIRRQLPDLVGKRVCIVDNLLISGATVHEMAKVLRRAGAKKIYAVVAARPAAPGDRVGRPQVHSSSSP